jgi:putative phosphoesterase
VRALVLADTHLRPDRRRTLPEEVWAEAARADVILHAGDVLTGELLDRLAEHAPLHAVLGNNDVTLADSLPETLELDLDGVAVAMVHDSGARVGRPQRMRRRFPEAAVVVYGHSHLPDDSEGVDGQRLFNPGSCTCGTASWWSIASSRSTERPRAEGASVVDRVPLHLVLGATPDSAAGSPRKQGLLPDRASFVGLSALALSVGSRSGGVRKRHV